MSVVKAPLVIKIGGALLDSPQHLRDLFNAIAKVKTIRPVVLVHGGGKLVEDWLQALGQRSTKLDGLRVTPPQQLPYVVGALAGAANKQLVALARKFGVTAVGLSLADGDLAECQVLNPRLGAVGQAVGGAGRLLDSLLADNWLVIVSSIGCDDDGQLLNVNADQGAIAVAQSLSAELLLLSDVPGVLDSSGQCLASLNDAQIEQLITEGVIRDGMAVKVKAALHSANLIGQPVLIAGWRDAEALGGLTGAQASGTRILPAHMATQK